MSSPDIQWYPGHIAKAEKQLQNQLQRVDVVLEVRDARIPLSTHHPDVARWVGDKSRVLVLNRKDMIPAEVMDQWQSWFRERQERPYAANAQAGKGVKAIAQAAQQAGQAMNERRRARGMRPRPVRAVVIGFPNVGKSALINRLLRKRVVDSARRPGVTRQLRWIRISDELELLDAPGVLPSQLVDQDAAVKLAICDDIGEAAYDNQRVAAAFVEQIKALQLQVPQYVSPGLLGDRYGPSAAEHTGEGYVVALGEHRYQGDTERAARQLLQDFRKGLLGPVPLELPETAAVEPVEMKDSSASAPG
ncbi:MAG: ribosome biogenesis GTPase YlqF [Cyanobacteria bacterium P01_A01_bin.135]